MNPGFVTDLIYRNSTLQFYPTFKRIRDFIMSIYDQIKDMVLNLERLEHRIYEDYPYTGKILKVNLFISILI